MTGAAPVVGVEVADVPSAAVFAGGAAMGLEADGADAAASAGDVAGAVTFGGFVVAVTAATAGAAAGAGFGAAVGVACPIAGGGGALLEEPAGDQCGDDRRDAEAGPQAGALRRRWHRWRTEADAGGR